MLANFKEVRAALLLAGCPSPKLEAEHGWVRFDWTNPETFNALMNVAEAYNLFPTSHGYENSHAGKRPCWIPVLVDKFDIRSLLDV